VSLPSGSRLGPYEILAPLGAGGMGEVYRAKDPRLGRDVAIKVLPATFSNDPDRLKRFEQEARAAGVLNHPNVTIVYDIGSHDGAPYVVQELLEGETLRSELAGGRFSPRKSIDYAVQIAQGLAAAHEKGIVHRDLKPENLFVTREGRVKILDFGLAKLTQAEGATAVTNIPTATEPGVVMGTLGYMSPEQVKARPADARSDIFALGAILYEMLSGHRAFRGDSAGETMAAILKEDPPDLSVTNQNISPGLERIVRHCLEKNHERRFQSASDIAFDLEALSVPGASTPRAVPSQPSARWRKPALIAIATGVVAGAGLLAGRQIWKSPMVSVPSYHRLTYRRGFVNSARFSPDAHAVYYSANWDGSEKIQIFSTRTENPGALLLDLPGAWVESIARSGELLILSDQFNSTGYAHRGVLRSAPLSGGAARDLFEDVVNADWAPDGQRIALVRAPGWRHRLEFPAGKVLYETAGWISHPRVSPKGDAIAFLDHPGFGDDAGSVALIDRNGKKTVLSSGWSSAQGVAWAPSGNEIWFTATEGGSNRALHAVTPSGRQRVVTRAPGVLTLQDIAGDGRVLLNHASERIGMYGLGADGKGRNLSWLDWSRAPCLSDDGGTVAFTEEAEGGGPGYSVYLRKTDGSSAVRLGEGEAIALSPDGKWVLSAIVRLDPTPLVLLPTGAGEPKPLPKDSIHHDAEPAAFFADGRRIVFVGSEPGHGRRTWVQDLEGGKARPVTPEGVVGTVLSPDGRLVAARGPDQKVALYPIDGGPAQPVEGIEPNSVLLRWSADPRFLYASSGIRGALVAKVYRVEIASGRREVWKEFSLPDPTGLSGIGCSAITPDGKTLVFTYSQQFSDLYLVDGLK
jgi:serine/threonine protein kinase/Tol biopolymer transport system component